MDAIGFVHSTGSENPIDPIPESMEGTHQASSESTLVWVDLCFTPFSETWVPKSNHRHHRPWSQVSSRKFTEIRPDVAQRSWTELRAFCCKRLTLLLFRLQLFSPLQSPSLEGRKPKRIICETWRSWRSWRLHIMFLCLAVHWDSPELLKLCGIKIETLLSLLAGGAGGRHQTCRVSVDRHAVSCQFSTAKF